MSRRNQKSHHKPSKPAARPTGPGDPGLKAFGVGNFTEAIRLWNESGPEKTPALNAAMAEAHFRRALAARPPTAESEADLRSAIALAPDSARYWYHLGLMLHRTGRLEEARQAYARSAELGMVRKGIGFVRGLAELEADPTVSLGTLPWLSPEACTALNPVSALLHNRPEEIPTASAPITDPVVALWQGLGLLARGDASRACTALMPPKGQRLPLGAEPIRAFYYGVATLMARKPEAAIALLQATNRPVAQPTAVRPPRWSVHISQICAQSIVAFQQAGQWAEMLALAQTGLTLASGDPWLLKAALIAANRLAEAAREAGDWAGARTYWIHMRNILQAHPTLGALPPILHNLAITNEALEEWEAAAQEWAALLNAMPRRSGRVAKKPVEETSGPSQDEQRVWLRRRVLDNYQRAERPDEAIGYYKQAVKSDPENLELRLELAAALLANEQEIAARNEIQRILAKDPNQIDALMLQAELHDGREEDVAAEQSLRRILEINPKHDKALRGIAQLLLGRGVDAFNNHQYARARSLYTDALNYAPNDPQLLIFLGETEFAVGKPVEGQKHFDTALATGNPVAYIKVFAFWIERQHKEAEARKILERAEADGIASPLFYIDLGVTCLQSAPPALGPMPMQPRRKTTPTKTQIWGRELIRQGLESASDTADALEHIIEALGPEHAAIGVEYAQQLVKLQPDKPEHGLSLGLLQALSGDTAGARASLSQAEREARKQGRKDLVEKIVDFRQEINSPMFGMIGSLMAMGLDPSDLEGPFIMKRSAPPDFRAPDPYVALGLTPSASTEEIKQAYFAQVRAHPPEREPAVFKQIRAAYERLNTPEKRLESDMLRFEAWSEPALTPPTPLERTVDPADVIDAAHACSDLARHDWREDWREVKL